MSNAELLLIYVQELDKVGLTTVAREVTVRGFPRLNLFDQAAINAMRRAVEESRH